MPTTWGGSTRATERRRSQHAYAATTYQAQGSTVDRAYVMADPSMDRQEFYVAASRSSRGDLLLRDPGGRLRARRVSRRRSPAARGPRAHRRSGRARRRPGLRPRRGAAHASSTGSPRRSWCDCATSLPRRPAPSAGSSGATPTSTKGSPAARPRSRGSRRSARRSASARAGGGRPGASTTRPGAPLDVNESMHRTALERFERERAELPPTAHEARAEFAAIDTLLDRRRDLALAAARVSPPDHIVAELGERPPEGRERARLGPGGPGDRRLPTGERDPGQRHRARGRAEGPGGAGGAHACAGRDQAGAAPARDRAGAGHRAGAGRWRSSCEGVDLMAALRVEIDEELIEQIAERAAELIGERSQAKEQDGWLRGRRPDRRLHRRTALAGLCARLGPAHPGPP